jgi:hypothetical protein
MKWIYNIIITSLVLVILVSCSNTHSIAGKDLKDIPPVTQKSFIEKPFGFEPTINNFRKNIVPPYKEQMYTMKNKYDPKLVDTIYRYYLKKSELFVYKTRAGRELFFAGNIYDNKISLFNGVYVGMHRGAFFNSFTDLKFNNNDTVKISSDQRVSRCKFIFKNDKLTGIKIENYID